MVQRISPWLPPEKINIKFDQHAYKNCISFHACWEPDRDLVIFRCSKETSFTFLLIKKRSLHFQTFLPFIQTTTHVFLCNTLHHAASTSLPYESLFSLMKNNSWFNFFLSSTFFGQSIRTRNLFNGFLKVCKTLNHRQDHIINYIISPTLIIV